MSDAHGHPKEAPGPNPNERLAIICLTIVAVVFIVAAYNGCVANRPTMFPNGVPPATTQSVTLARRASPKPTLYRFFDYADGCARAELRSDASFYPKGGKVRIHPPPPGKPWDDEPGVQSTADGTSQRSGWYLICRVDPDAWGVEIWN